MKQQCCLKQINPRRIGEGFFVPLFARRIKAAEENFYLVREMKGDPNGDGYTISDQSNKRNNGCSNIGARSNEQ